MGFSVRLDARTAAIVRRLSKQTGESTSEVIREAIRQLAEADVAYIDALSETIAR